MKISEAVREAARCNGDGESPAAFARWLEQSLEKSVGPDEIDLDGLEQELRAPGPEWGSGLVFCFADSQGEQPDALCQPADTQPGEHPPFGMDWLQQQALLVHTQSPALSQDELVEHLVAMLESHSPNLQDELLGFVGLAFVELVGSLLSHREQILASYAAFKMARTPPAGPKPPGQTIQVSTAVMKAEAKAVERMRRKYHDPNVIGLSTTKHFDTAEARAAQQHPALEAILKQTAEARPPPPPFPNVFRATRAEGAATSFYQSKLALPPGTIRRDTAHFEEFTLPYTQSYNPRAEAIEIVQICNLDPVSRKAFPSYTALNRMQSAVFPVAFGSSENMLVCAPTGAGKTDVAMLAILKTIQDYRDPGAGRILREAFKIIYVAPMKALAAEITAKFSKRLGRLGLVVREYTGDMQLTRRQIQEAQMIVTTPEKWDVVTRKGQGDVDLVQLVRLLIVDEIHLLQDDRGPVLECIVARTLREVEMSQRPVRIVGLSATLPNYVDVASFLRVNHHVGMFYFDEGFRPVPLTQSLIGVKGNDGQVRERMNQVCYERCVAFVRDGHQVMVFVHSRNDTVATAKALIRLAREENATGLFVPAQPDKAYLDAFVEVSKNSRNRELQDLFKSGFAMHHAGMLRSDRSLVERLFAGGHVRVLICTATLAWGVNLPAHAVLIKGTMVFDSQKGGYVQLGILDVLQIFGRAGRPQYETHGEAMILTKQNDLAHYLTALLSQVPIESRFASSGHLVNNLNAEIALGTVSNIREAISWLGYTYLTIRMQRNPTAYGITPKELAKDPLLHEHLAALIKSSAMQLCNAGMISFDDITGEGRMQARDVGRIASLYYLGHDTIELFGKEMRPNLNEEEILAIAVASSEFDNLQVRQEELEELDLLTLKAVKLQHPHDMTTSAGKTATIIQAIISKCPVESFSLASDMNYVNQNAGRILRAVFEIARTQAWAKASRAALNLSKAFEQRVWMMSHPLFQFASNRAPLEVLEAVEHKKLPIEVLKEYTAKDVEALMQGKRVVKLGPLDRVASFIREAAKKFPRLTIESVSVMFVNSRLAQIDVSVIAKFAWDSQFHGDFEFWWAWLETADGELMLRESCQELSVSQSLLGKAVALRFFLPVSSETPSRIMLRIVSDRWLNCEALAEVPLERLKRLPLKIDPTPSTLTTPVSQGDFFSTIKSSKLPRLIQDHISAKGDTNLSPVEGRMINEILNSDSSFLMAAPSGSRPSFLIELAVWKQTLSRNCPKSVLVTFSATLGRESADAWPKSFGELGLRVFYLSEDLPTWKVGDEVKNADVVVTTIGTWNSWFNLTTMEPDTRSHLGFPLFDITKFGLCILANLECAAKDSLPLERFAAKLPRFTRTLAFASPISNISDIAAILQIDQTFNFGQNCRPVPLQVQIHGFPGRFYASRMASMDKYVYQAVMHSKSKDETSPATIIWCSTKRQLLLTAQSLISYAMNDDNPKQFLGVRDEATFSQQLEFIQDKTLRHMLGFGIGLIHGGLSPADIDACQVLFEASKISALIATSELLERVTCRARLVIIKGTECFEASSQSYTELPFTRIIDIVELAGRPRDSLSTAVILTRDINKNTYKFLLGEPFVIESDLIKNQSLEPLLLNILFQAPESISFSEIVHRVRDMTFLGRRMAANPLRYGARSDSRSAIDELLWEAIQEALKKLAASNCLLVRGNDLECTSFGRLACIFNVNYQTVGLFFASLDCVSEQLLSLSELMRVLCMSFEYEQIPMRYREADSLLALSQDPKLQLAINWLQGRQPDQKPASFTEDFNLVSTKVILLLLAHLSGIKAVSLKAVWMDDMEEFVRVSLRKLEVLLWIAKEKNSLSLVKSILNLAQILKQGTLPPIPKPAESPRITMLNKIATSGAGDRKRLVKVSLLARLADRMNPSFLTAGWWVFVSHEDKILVATKLNTEGWKLLEGDSQQGGKVMLDLPLDYAAKGPTTLKLSLISDYYWQFDQSSTIQYS